MNASTKSAFAYGLIRKLIAGLLPEDREQVGCWLLRSPLVERTSYGPHDPVAIPDQIGKALREHSGFSKPWIKKIPNMKAIASRNLMKPLLLAALAAILSCSPAAAEESPPDAPAMTGDEIVAMYQKRGTAPRASLYCGEGRREVEVFDDGAGGVLSFGPGPDENFRIHPKRIDFARISKELSDAVLEQAERTSAGVLFRGRGGGPHPDYRSGPLKPETARGMIRRFEQLRHRNRRSAPLGEAL